MLPTAGTTSQGFLGFMSMSLRTFGYLDGHPATRTRGKGVNFSANIAVTLLTAGQIEAGASLVGQHDF